MAKETGKLDIQMCWRDLEDGHYEFWLEIGRSPVSRCVRLPMRRAGDSVGAVALLALKEVMSDSIYTRTGDYDA